MLKHINLDRPNSQTKGIISPDSTALEKQMMAVIYAVIVFPI